MKWKLRDDYAKALASRIVAMNYESEKLSHETGKTADNFNNGLPGFPTGLR